MSPSRRALVLTALTGHHAHGLPAAAQAHAAPLGPSAVDVLGNQPTSNTVLRVEGSATAHGARDRHELVPMQGPARSCARPTAARGPLDIDGHHDTQLQRPLAESATRTSGKPTSRAVYA